MWRAEVSAPDDIDLEVQLEENGNYRWTVWFIRLIRSGTAATLEEAQAGAHQDLTEMADRYRADLSPNLYRMIRTKPLQWKASE